MMLKPMSGPNEVRVVTVLEARVKGVGGFAIIRSIPFGNAVMRISGEILRASLGRAESQSCTASYGSEEVQEYIF